MKNNIRAIFFQIFMTILVFLSSFIINMSSIIRELVYTHIFFKLLLLLLVVLIYYNLGKGMSKRKNRKFDFLSGVSIFIISVFLYLIAFMGLGTEVFYFPIASSMWRLPMDVFMMPEIYILTIFGLGQGLVSLLLISLLPTFIYGLSIKNSRRKISRQKRIRRIQENRRKRMDRHREI